MTTAAATPTPPPKPPVIEFNIGTPDEAVCPNGCGPLTFETFTHGVCPACSSFASIPAGLVPPDRVQVQYRKDGWPLCPQCGEDELTSLGVLVKGFRPEDFARWLSEGRMLFKCLSCLWTNDAPEGRVPPALRLASDEVCR